MINVKDLLVLSVEEKSELLSFERELDKVTLFPQHVISETEISKIEASLTHIIEEIVERGRQQTNKSNA